MTDRPKRSRDANQLAKFIVDMATGEEPEHISHVKKTIQSDPLQPFAHEFRTSDSVA